VASQALRFVVRTPHAKIFHVRAASLRVPTETGWVGILPGAERSVLVIEPGLVIVRTDHALALVGTGGGVLHIERDRVTLLASIAVLGDDASSVRAALDRMAGESSAEIELRRGMDGIERGLLAQSRRRALSRPAGRRDV
jgi:F-type H+-transporting ATPase subunit epsilon